MTLPRGMRVNNPGNIEKSKPGQKGFKGEVIPSRDKRFATYESLDFGCRALFRQLILYNQRGTDTVREIISKWAPPLKDGKRENDTEAYIDSVCARTGYLEDQPIEDTFEMLQPIANAIARHEQGGDYVDMATWRRAWELVKGV